MRGSSYRSCECLAVKHTFQRLQWRNKGIANSRTRSGLVHCNSGWRYDDPSLKSFMEFEIRLLTIAYQILAH